MIKSTALSLSVMNQMNWFQFVIEYYVVIEGNGKIGLISLSETMNNNKIGLRNPTYIRLSDFWYRADSSTE